MESIANEISIIADRLKSLSAQMYTPKKKSVTITFSDLTREFDNDLANIFSSDHVTIDMSLNSFMSFYENTNHLILYRQLGEIIFKYDAICTPEGHTKLLECCKKTINCKMPTTVLLLKGSAVKLSSLVNIATLENLCPCTFTDFDISLYNALLNVTMTDIALSKIVRDILKRSIHEKVYNLLTN